MTAALTVAAAAAELHQARLDRTAVPTLTDRWPDMTTADAYAVQAEGIRLREADGERVVGGKLGFTSEAMRRAMGVTDPNYGWLTDAMDCNTAVVDLTDFIHPKVEPEIAFILGRELSGQVRIGDVLDATAAVAPCLEIVDSRYVDFRFAARDNIADNSSAGAFLLGEPTTVDHVHLPLMEVQVEADGQPHATATGAAAHGHPAGAVAWMVSNAHQPFPAGSIVISGGLTTPVDLQPGTSVTAVFDRLGQVTLTAK